MKYAVYSGLLFLAIVLQTTLMPELLILGVQADLLCVVLLCIAIRQGPFLGGLMGGICGLVLDLLFMRPGFYAVIYFALGFAGGFFPRRIRFDRWIMPALLCFALYSGKEFLQLIYLYFLRVDINFSVAVVKMLLGAAVTTALFIPVGWMLQGLHRFSFMQEGVFIGREGD